MVKITKEKPMIPVTPAPMNFKITVTADWVTPQPSKRFPNQLAMKLIGSLKKFILLSFYSRHNNNQPIDK
jgi:hypothetical protein